MKQSNPKAQLPAFGEFDAAAYINMLPACELSDEQKLRLIDAVYIYVEMLLSSDFAGTQINN